MSRVQPIQFAFKLYTIYSPGVGFSKNLSRKTKQNNLSKYLSKKKDKKLAKKQIIYVCINNNI